MPRHTCVSGPIRWRKPATAGTAPAASASAASASAVTGLNGWFTNDGLRLARYLVAPTGHDLKPIPGVPALILCHGFPVGPIDARLSANTFPEFVDRASNALGWAAMTFTFRGCGESEGSFSLAGWMSDLSAAIDHLIAEVEPSTIMAVGTSTGGSIALCVAETNPSVNGVAVLGARSDFSDWAGDPLRFLAHCREVGTVTDPEFPADFEAWSAELAVFDPARAAAALAPRPLLVLHGDDDEVPLSHGRRLVDAHGSGSLRVIHGGGHRLRHDPRAVAQLLGWLSRQV